MPRPKGSKNKKTFTLSMESLDEKISIVESELQDLQSSVRAKKAELKQLQDQKREFENQRALEALAATGKSPEDILMIIDKLAGKSTETILEALEMADSEKQEN